MHDNNNFYDDDHNNNYSNDDNDDDAFDNNRLLAPAQRDQHVSMTSNFCDCKESNYNKRALLTVANGSICCEGSCMTDQRSACQDPMATSSADKQELINQNATHKSSQISTHIMAQVL